MYGLDINFLNDRPYLKSDKRRVSRSMPTISADDRRPLLIGIGMCVIFPAIALFAWSFLTVRSGDLERQQADLDTQLGHLADEKKNLASVNEEIKQTTEEAQSLATVFNQIKPWSAMSQDIRDRLPANIQLVEIKQIEPKAQPSPAPSTNASSGGAPASSAPVSGVIQIDGLASSFSDVNDFLLTLQQSNFLKSDQTKLINAELGEQVTLQSLEVPGLDRDKEVKPPKLPRRVKFSLRTALSDVPASELIRELDRKGSVGLVTRIEALKERGVIQAQSNQTRSMKDATQNKGETKP